jgi:AcrR family transcriptional regulator
MEATPHPIQDTPQAVDSSEDVGNRNEQIVAAAYDLLEEEGLEGLTIRAVLKRTGLARRAFYDRFAGKDDLVLTVFEQTIRMAVALYTQEVLLLPDPLSRLRHIVMSIVLGQETTQGAREGQGSKRGAALSREHLRLGESRPAELQAAIGPLIELIANQLADGMTAGQVRRAPPQRLAVLVYNLVSTTVHSELLAEEDVGPNRQRRTQLAEDIWEFCQGAVAA